MTPAEIEAIYRELETMFVRLEPEPERGLDYLKERLVFCRAMQDRLQEMRLKVNRAQSELMESKLVAQHTHSVDPEAVKKSDIATIDGVLQRVVMLGRMIGMQATVLSRTSMDIRLLADLTKEQLRRGQVNPHEAPSLIREVPISELATVRTGAEERADPPTFPIPPPTGEAPPSPFVGGTAGVGVVGSVTTSPFTPVKAQDAFVSIDGPAPIDVTPPMLLHVPESRTVPIAELLESMNGTSSPRVF